MRVMVVQPGPRFSVADVANGVCEGLRLNGCDTRSFNLDDRLDFYTQAHVWEIEHNRWRKALDHSQALTLAVNSIYAACYQYWPDIIVLISGFYTPPALYNTLRSRRHKLVLWCTESPYEDTHQILQAPFADLCVLNDPTNLAAFREKQPNTHYIPHSYDPKIHHRRAAQAAAVSDFFWVGTGYPSRQAFFEAVDWTGIDAKLAGNWELLPEGSPLEPLLTHERVSCLDNDDAVVYYSNTKASANIYRREFGDGDVLKPVSAGWAMGPREVELAATGTFFLTEERGENREVLSMVPTFDGPGDFSEKLRWWLAHDRERDEVAAKAQAAVADRTFEAHTAQMLQFIGA